MITWPNGQKSSKDTLKTINQMLDIVLDVNDYDRQNGSDVIP